MGLICLKMLSPVAYSADYVKRVTRGPHRLLDPFFARSFEMIFYMERYDAGR
jgi:hypothetical protein